MVASASMEGLHTESYLCTAASVRWCLRSLTGVSMPKRRHRAYSMETFNGVAPSRV